MERKGFGVAQRERSKAMHLKVKLDEKHIPAPKKNIGVPHLKIKSKNF